MGAIWSARTPMSSSIRSSPVCAVGPKDWRWSSYCTTLRISDDFPFVEASLLVAEAGGSTEALRRAVDARARERLSRVATAGV